MNTLKQQIEDSLLEATTAKYDYKINELTNILSLFEHTDFPEELIKGLWEDIEKKRPRIL